GTPWQVVAPELALDLPLSDLCALPAGCREATAERQVRAEATRPFDLAAGPLLRALLLRLGAEDWIVVLTLHHIVSDGWSLDVLVREVAAFYEAAATGRPAAL